MKLIMWFITFAIVIYAFRPPRCRPYCFRSVDVINPQARAENDCISCFHEKACKKENYK